jgi:hypothetical protein
MRILLDECVPWPIYRILARHSCTSVQAEGWSGIRNSELLGLAAGKFDLLITSDQNIRYQQNLNTAGIAVLQLSTNDLRRIQAAGSMIEAAVEKLRRKSFSRWTFPEATIEMFLQPPLYQTAV